MNKPWTDKSKGMNSLADRIAGLSPAKRALMELRLKKKEPVVSGEQHIPQREKRSSAPLSFAQQRLWFLNQMGTGSAYNIPPLAIRLKGLPNIKALEESLNEIIRRHDALRTTFRSAGGRPVQVIEENISSKMPLIDLSGQPKAEREAEAERLTREEAMRRFDLAKGPLFSAALIRLSEEEHILLLTMHHIVSDGWSKGVITAELAALYKAYCNGEASPLPELPIQYADFAHWQREWLQGEVLENQLSYWRKQLAGVPVLQLFTDRPRPAVQTFAGASQNIALSPTLTGALNDLSQRQGVTLFMTLLAAFQTLLYRHTGQEDIVVGSPIANRNRSEIEGLIGFFVNSLAMRTDLSGNPSFLELLGRVGEVAFGAFEHQDLPFEKLVEELHPERDMSRTPLFQIMFVLQNTPAGKLQLPGLTLSSFAMERITVRFDIEIHLWEKPEGLSGRVVYNTDLFDDATIARWMEHYETLLESIVADPDQRISDLQILTDTERQQLLVEWNATETDYPRDRCVHQLFEQQVEQSPDAVAVVFKDQELTYRELNCRANQLAHHLQSLGVEPEVLVGICMQRSLEMIVGLLGVLKAGGAYVPLDSNYPAERLSFMLQDTGVPVLLIQKRLLNALPECRAKVICLDTDWAVIGKESEENLDSGATASNLAYVMYTSGSTGKPKGVCCNHAGMVNLLSDFAHRQPLHTGEGCSLWTSISFDVSVYEIFSALPAGGTLYIVPESVRSSAMTFVRWLSEHKIKSAYLPPFALSDLCDWLSGKQGKLCLSRLLVGVEPIQEQILAEIIRQVPGLQIINGYGPTEATICATLYSVKNLSVQNGNTPIGRPVQNTNIYLLNTDLKLVPIGNPGELYIGGVGLARGYLNRAELTAEKFIPNPFSDKKGDRLYKSGDLVRYLQDGSIEFLGRIDHQVKIRGFRIELGEIESVLSRHPKVSDTVVIAREDVPGDKRLVAYVVASHEPTPTFSELRSFLKEKLPDYMIPSAFGYLDSLPLTPNGKVDRRALPAPDVVRPDLQEAFVAPRSQSEELVAGIWSSVLGLERIGVYDSFFELGGHSLLAVQIVSRIREVFEVELPLRALFEAPTVAGLTERIEAARRSDEGLQTSPLQAVSRDQDLPLSFAQERLWFLHHLEPDSVAYSMPRSIRLKGMLNKDALEKTYVELACRHETLRTTFDSTDGNPVLRISAEPNIVLDTVDLRHLPGMEREAEVKRLSAEDARKPFDLARGPLFRIRLFQLEDEAHVLHSNMHHIISDGWSFGVMAREIAALYTAFIKGKPVDLPELPVQYADYAVWQRQWLQGEALGAQLNYWKDKLGGELPVLELPTDRPRPAVQTHRGAIESLALPKELTDALQVMSRREGVTLFMTLLAAFKTLLYRHTGQEDTIVGTPIAGRNRTELEGLIGFFMNTIVLRTDLSGQPSFRELLGRVRETALGAYAHQDMPFAKLVEELAPKRDLSRTPLFQVFFNHIVAMDDKAAALPGLKAAAVGGLDRESKFDMTLTVLEGESGLAGRFEYNADLFDAERVERMVGHFQTLLEGIVTDPGKCICDLPILDEAERRQLLVTWNDTVMDYPKDKFIHELFEDQVNQTPDAIAVADKNEQITYQALNTRANQLTHYLKELGVGPQVVVGLCTKRSVEMVIGIMGILKAGGIYLPLDPSYPEQRLSFMLEDSHALILLSDENSRSVLPKGKARIVYIDLNDGIFTRHSSDNPVSCVTAETPAYLIYTSGSTGRAKGVIGQQRGLLNRFNWMWKTYPFEAGDVCCQKTSISFVDSIWEILGPLLQGIKTVIVSDEMVQEPRLFIKYLAEEQITRIIAVPSYLRVILDADPDMQVRLPKLKFWVSSGEILSKELYQRFCEKLPQSLLLNLYGSSEVSADVTCYDPNSMSPIRQSVPIGRPIANTQVYILDPNLQPVPVGVPGELYIAGDNLAAGYLNLSKTTENSFIPNPFSDKPDSRLFKTGDNGRWLVDGNIEFIERVDHQVKIRGFRIELGEVETVLSQHPGVREAAVIARENLPDEKRLVAYYVPIRKQTPTIDELRRYLKQKLPDYMVPAAFVLLDALPLMPNGKVDRRALPAPDNVRQESAETFVAPRDDLELKLTKIWEKVLGIKNVGIKDNFFDLGGHSLLAVRLFALLRKRFSNDLPLAALFQAPTVEELAKIVSEEIRPTSWTSLVPMQTEGSNPPFFCVPQAGSTIYSLSNLARHLGPNQPFYGLQPLGIDGENSPHTRIEDMAAHYIEEIKSVQPQGPYLLGGRCFGSSVAFEMAQQLCAQGEDVALLAILGDNFIPAWARKGVESSNSALSLTHSFQRTIYYLRHSSLGDVFRTAVSEVSIRVNPYLKGTKRILKAQLLARANYIRRPYPGRVTLFASRSSSRPTYSKSTLAGLAEGGVDFQKVPRVYDRLLDEPHVQVVAAKLIACINKALDERFTTKPYTRQAVVAQARKKNGDSTRQVSGTENSPMSTYADARPTDSGTRLNLSLVLPCYNEGPHFSDKIEEIVQALDAAELEYEIILIDDRSTDETAQQIRSYLSGQHKRNIRAYYHDTNLGRGATVAEGIRLANGTYVGFIDIDLEIPPQFIPAALDALVSDSADMVLGNRKRNGAQESPLRLVMSSVYRWLVSQLLKTDSLDTEAGFKFFRRDLILPVLDEVQDSHWFWDTEITVVAQAKGLRIHSLPVTYCRDLTKQSTVRPFQDSWRSFAALLAFAKRHRFARHAVTRKQTP